MFYALRKQFGVVQSQMLTFYLLCPPLIAHARVNQNRKSDPAFADKIRHVRDPKARMQVVWNFCKSKMICEPDEPKDDNDNEAEEPKKGHGGCGAAQPQIRKEGLKLFVQYKRSKDEDEVGPPCGRAHMIPFL